MNFSDDQQSDELDRRKAELRRQIAFAESRDHIATEIELLREYLQIDPASTRYRYQYGDSLRSAGMLDEAERVLRSTDIGEIPESRRYLVELSIARIHEDRGEFVEARNRYVRAVDLRRDSTVPWVFLAAFLAKQGKLDEATAVLRQATNATGDLDEVYLNLGNSARAMGQYKQALDYYNTAVSISPVYPEATLAIADLTEAMEIRARRNGDADDSHAAGGNTNGS